MAHGKILGSYREVALSYTGFCECDLYRGRIALATLLDLSVSRIKIARMQHQSPG